MENRKFKNKEIKLLARQALEKKWKKIVPIFLIYILLATAVPGVLTDYFNPLTYSNPLYALAINSGASLYSILVVGPFAVGAAALVLNLIRRKRLSLGTIFDGFKCWPTSFCTLILISIYSVLWIILSQLPFALLLGGAIFTGNTNFNMTNINQDNFVNKIDLFFSTSDSISLYLTIGALVASIVFLIAVLIFLLRYSMSFFVVADRTGHIKASEAINESKRILKGHKLKLFGLSLSFIGWALLLGLAASAASILYYIFSFSSLSGGPLIAVLVAMILVALGTLIGYTALSAYIQTSYAVFYSIYSGNVKIDDLSEEKTVDFDETDFGEDMASQEPVPGDLNASAANLNSSAGDLNASATDMSSSAGDLNASAADLNSSAADLNSSDGDLNASARDLNSSDGDLNASAGDLNVAVATGLSAASNVSDTATSADKNLKPKKKEKKKWFSRKKESADNDSEPQGYDNTSPINDSDSVSLSKESGSNIPTSDVASNISDNLQTDSVNSSNMQNPEDYNVSTEASNVSSSYDEKAEALEKLRNQILNK